MSEVKLAATRDAYGKALAQLGKENPNVVVLDADLSASTKTAEFGKLFPDRFFNMGVAEQDMISTAAGLAACGKIAFASTFAVFGSGRAWDQVRLSVAYTRANVKIVVTHAGIVTGEDGASHQANEDIAIMRVIPNMTVVVPSDSVETEKVIRAAAEFHGPMYIRLSRPKTPIINAEDYKFQLGRGVVLRPGKDLTIFSCGIMVATALDAAADLAGKGIEAEVINLHTIKPLDKKLIVDSAKRTGAVVTVEEHSILGGLGGAVAEVLVENCAVPMVRVGLKDVFGESGKPDELLVKYGLTAEEIVKAARSVIKRKS
ncbi:transketolase [candidate division WOR-1 bacterium RIFOXYA12_FULL_52_29]|uniref:Transketolase n=1 Tax=candidate division WOR-1 bacterium RIFOXYC12_FULL_54_18 TaxID=1802584 RepID=A0A1F4T4W7_UNCSA|nr:MAG: transketolase [candidate division WOR-1 bacterium RIFOXYA2_FULL_51_19]OGC17347.1 MAG: transketolase [candidate division WOR-1 bacterium RIFOXYA12_FULL_52_29]OGC26206.1 MAG: transketolase [candidate division WOR-1 bacterium RIFOXYB2_FULL_45_9]OGC27764.1 MAG: transketolase [candidate division WOR-1 bacterium RIFOXYC12_FULL_54_18]OGC29946.1 MAG: transketolase [candidate division WOR-1 bacterium RIFOXYB12_FULL_52_16]